MASDPRALLLQHPDQVGVGTPDLTQWPEMALLGSHSVQSRVSSPKLRVPPSYPLSLGRPRRSHGQHGECLNLQAWLSSDTVTKATRQEQGVPWGARLPGEGWARSLHADAHGAKCAEHTPQGVKVQGQGNDTAFTRADA